MKDKAFKDLLARLDAELVAVVKDDIRQHLQMLQNAGIVFYGYAIQTPSFTNVEQPIACYNSENDIREENQESAYHRYSVDEWQHYENRALPKTTELMVAIDQQFIAVARNPDDPAKLEKYYKKVYTSFARALAELKADGAFTGSCFLIVWNEDEELLVKFAKQLNARPVAKVFAEEFGL